jgi:ribosomal protein S4
LSTWWLIVMARSFRRGGVTKRPLEAATRDVLDARLDEELAQLD